MPTDVTGQNQALPTLGDLDGDGDLDLLVGSYYDYYYFTDNLYGFVGGFFYFENGGTTQEPTFSAHPDNPNPYGLTPFDNIEPGTIVPRFADLDADGDLDVVNVSYYVDGAVEIHYYENTGSSFGPADPIASVAYANSGVPTLGDLDGDGDLDLLIGHNPNSSYSPEFNYIENIGSATVSDFSSTPQTNPFSLTGIPPGVAPVLADLDGDGTLDILAGDNFGNLHYFENVGSPEAPEFAAPVQNPFGLPEPSTETSTERVVPTFGDLDGDGDIDLMVGEYSQQDASIFYFENEAR